MSTNERLTFFATTPKGLELLLVDELRALGASDAAEKLAGVSFSGDITLAYRVLLWSRLANRVLLFLGDAPAKTPEELYAGVRNINWDKHLALDSTFAVHCVISQSTITHSMFAAQKIKDAIVDQFREKYEQRPNVARHEPDLPIYVYLHRDKAYISLDLSGESLHKRGYRIAGGKAPLKENLAAAILLRANWPEIAKEGGCLMDPLCGSGTLLIEAAWMAGDIAPGLMRHYFGFSGWKKHQDEIWQSLLKEARVRKEQGERFIPPIVGYDNDAAAIKIAFENIERANLRGKVHVEKRELDQFTPKANVKSGLVITNPPYGERLGEEEALQPLYTLLGDKLKEGFTGWHAGVFTGNPDLGKQMGLRAKRYYSLFNGPIPCKLLLFDVKPPYFIDRSESADNERRIRKATRAVATKDQQHIQMFINRLQKNLKHLSRVAKRQGLTNYRVYDADLPEYAFAIDLTENGAEVVEYQAPKSIDPNKVLQRQQEVLAVLPTVLNLPAANISFRIEPRVSRRKENGPEKNSKHTDKQ